MNTHTYALSVGGHSQSRTLTSATPDRRRELQLTWPTGVGCMEWLDINDMTKEHEQQIEASATEKPAQSYGDVWISVDKKLPQDGQRVFCKYEGVYKHRMVTFWRDNGGNPHFGRVNELDGKGSQPATHWKAL